MNTTLYINPLTPEINFLIFDGEETRVATLEKNLDTASIFPKMIVDIVDQYTITDIWCIAGPGPFTLMRVITLAINAISYTRAISVRSCHFFDLISEDHQPIIEANLREYLIREGREIISIAKWDLPEWIYEGIFADIDSTVKDKSIQYKEDRSNIIRVFSMREKESRISPIYFKPPHITWPKQ